MTNTVKILQAAYQLQRLYLLQSIAMQYNDVKYLQFKVKGNVTTNLLSLLCGDLFVKLSGPYCGGF